MIKLKNIFVILAAGLAGLGTQQASALSFSETSQLSNGKWVRIGVPANGVYEFSYEQLRALGFSNPEKVRIWGDGGVMYPADYINVNSGERLIPDAMSQVAVWHHGNKLYFYGKGPENLSWKYESAFTIPGRISNNGRNIYSNLGVYFLSDRGEDKGVTAATYQGDTSNVLDYAYGYYIHERDLNQGVSHSGQTFWGEDFLGKGLESQNFDYKAPMAKPGSKGIFNVIFNGVAWLPSTLDIKIDGSSIGQASIPARSNDFVMVIRNSNQNFEMEAPAASGTVNLTWTPPNCDKLQARLDYFMFTYTRELKFADNESQFSVQAVTGNPAALAIPAGDDVVCWDVSTASAPQSLSSNGNVAPIPAGARAMTFFRTSASQPTPEVLGEVTNRDLRQELLSANPEMVIITTTDFEQRARQLAEFHREHDNAVVSVVNVNDIYNEFSSGRPEPMAYRSMLRMLHSQSNSRLRAVLLYGPQRSNVRIEDSYTPREAIITYQYPNGDNVEDQIGFTDIYGIFADYMPKFISTLQMSIAVGNMPVLSDTEAERYFNKVVRYTLDDSRAYWMERMLMTADDMDTNSHCFQTENTASKFSYLRDNTLIFDKVYFSEYGYPAVKQPLYDAFNQGASYSLYIGHGSPTQLGKKAAFLTPSDIGHFRNKRLGFMTFASCETSLYELGARGISEHLVLSTNDGLVGMFGTTRTALSIDNYNFMLNMTDMISRLSDSNTGRPAEIGEIIRRSKNSLTGHQGKYKFQLVCDPLLRMYVPTLSGSLTKKPEVIVPGEPITFEGRFSSPSGFTTSDFNGDLVVKWYQPAYTTPSHSKVANDPLKSMEITYNSEVAATQNFEIKDGRFSINPEVPEVMRAYAGDTVRVSITAYDAENRIGGTMSVFVAVDTASAGQPSKDNQAPVIDTFTIEGASQGSLVPSDITLLLEAYDDSGLRVDEKSFDTPLQIIIDGNIQPTGVADYARLAEGARRMTIRYPLSGLAAGQHTAVIRISDYAGNTSSAEVTFEVGSSGPAEAPVLAETACRSQATLMLADDVKTQATDAVIIITDAHGREVNTAPWTDTEHKWNLTDSNGRRVAPGLYKAYVRYTDNKGRSAVTKGVYVPVLSSK